MTMNNVHIIIYIDTRVIHWHQFTPTIMDHFYNHALLGTCFADTKSNCEIRCYVVFMYFFPYLVILFMYFDWLLLSYCYISFCI